MKKAERLYRQNDVVNPLHYRTGGKECIDIIRETLGDDLFIGYCKGNAMKYRHRAGRKGHSSICLAKAEWYSQMALHVSDPENEKDPRD